MTNQNEFDIFDLLSEVENDDFCGTNTIKTSVEFSDDSPEFMLIKTDRTENHTENGVIVNDDDTVINLPLHQVRAFLEALDVCIQEHKVIEFDFVTLTPSDDDGIIFTYEDKTIEFDLDRVVYLEDYIKAELGC